MKKNRFMVLMGGVLFLLGAGLNLQYSMDEYGIVKNSLHLEVLAQSGNSGSSTGYSSGYQDSHDIKCTKTSTSTVVSDGSSSGSGGGSVSGNWGYGNWGVGGSISGGGSSSSGSHSSTTTTTVTEIHGKRYFCMPPRNFVETCTNFNPCD